VLAAEIGPTGSLLEVALLPDQAPEAVQLVELLEDQVRVLLPPLVTVAGEALNDNVGIDPPVDDSPLGADELPTPPLQAVRRPSRNRPSTAWGAAHARCRRPRKRLPI
jgi:hypothetical protein